MQLDAIELTLSQSSFFFFVEQEGDSGEQAQDIAMSVARTNMSRIEKWKGLMECMSFDAVEEEDSTFDD